MAFPEEYIKLEKLGKQDNKWEKKHSSGRVAVKWEGEAS